MSKINSVKTVDIDVIKRDAIHIRLGQIRNLMDICLSKEKSYERKFAAFLHLAHDFDELVKDIDFTFKDASDKDFEKFCTDAQLIDAFSEAFS